MRPTRNAFSIPPGTTDGRLASMLRPLQAARHEVTHGHGLEISPMRAVDAFRALFLDEDESGSEILLSRFDQADWTGSRGQLTARALAERLGIDLIADVDDGCLIMTPEAALQLIGTVPTRMVDVTRVEGPIEHRDARDMLRAIGEGRSPLAVELRATQRLVVRGDRGVSVEAHDERAVLHLLGENFRHYLSALLREPLEWHAAPENDQLHRLLAISGQLSVRPIETDIFSTSVDVGIGTHTSTSVEAASRSLVFDRPSRTWHDDAR